LIRMEEIHGRVVILDDPRAVKTQEDFSSSQAAREPRLKPEVARPRRGQKVYKAHFPIVPQQRPEAGNLEGRRIEEILGTEGRHGKNGQPRWPRGAFLDEVGGTAGWSCLFDCCIDCRVPDKETLVALAHLPLVHGPRLAVDAMVVAVVVFAANHDRCQRFCDLNDQTMATVHDNRLERHARRRQAQVVQNIQQTILELAHVGQWLVRILEAHQGLLTLGEVEAQWESRWVTAEQWRGAGMREAVAFMAECLHQPLRDFHARLEIREEPWPQHDLLAAVPSLYAVLCLQMWNHIAEQTPYRVCQRPDCGRLFVRQQGRAKYDQHKRSGSLFCTVQCARVVASRKFREEKRKTSG
jgi:hypothetical protein